LSDPEELPRKRKCNGDKNAEDLSFHEGMRQLKIKENRIKTYLKDKTA